MGVAKVGQKMKRHKIRVGVIFGGKSTEHEVSLLSAKNVVAALDREKYEIVRIKINKEGGWEWKKEEEIDVVFPVLHGPLGEDGTVQGFLKLIGVPFVGPSVLGSAIGMDKDVQKRLLRDAGVPVAKFITVRSRERAALSFAEIKKKLGLPFFVKPANAGSSVGVHKVKKEADFAAAITDAFRYDTKILIEEGIVGQEIECAVLGNEEPAASVPGEVKPNHEFYSYEAKYLDENGAGLLIPAKLSPHITKKVQETALVAFKVLECEGMSRVDCFVTKDEHVLVNEINTIPGFTKISMYPKLWNASGVSYSALLDRLISLALARAAREKKLKTTFN